MSLKIDQGLFNLDFVDYHAILGVPVDAEAKEIRKHYLKIARRLHPDSYTADNPADRQQAVELLSKLVNPAYEKLSNERNYHEYCILLRLKGQQALKQQETILLVSQAAQKLAATSDIESTYKTALRDLSAQQYQELSQTLILTGEISELNLVYLMRKEGRGETATNARPQQPVTSTATSSSAPTGTAPTPAVPPSRDALIEGYLRRAQEFESKQDYAKAILELRDAIRLDPSSSNCHSRLGIVYFKTNQPTMAKIHFNQALKLNPEDPIALEGKRRVDPSSEPQRAASAKKVDPKSRKPSDNSGGGLFGLFGGKKK